MGVAAAKPDFEACPGFEDNSYVNPWSLTLNPDPIVAKEGAEVKAHFDATVLKQLTVGTKVDIKMVKEENSCNYDAEDLLALITPEDCKKFAPEGQACSLPLNPGFYGDHDPNGFKAFVLPNIPFIVRPFLSGSTAV